MKLFFLRHTLDVVNIHQVQHVVTFDMVTAQRVDWATLKGHVLWLYPSAQDIDAVISAALADHLYKLRSLTLAVADPKETTYLIKRHFRIIKAAGGVVTQGNKLLLIHRRGCWDLPKGKCKQKEPPADTAVREIAEECGVHTKTIDKIGTTYHVLPPKNDTYGLKKINWYSMELLDASRIRPQKEEGIEEVAWFDEETAHSHLQESYPSIRYLMQLRQLRMAQGNSQ